MGLLQRVFDLIPGARGVLQKATLPNEQAVAGNRDSERGRRPTPEAQLNYLYRVMWVDPDLRQAILDVREMDKEDGRVKKIHGRVARDAVKGGLILQQATENKTVSKLWQDFGRRLQLDRAEKLKSDARGLVMEGNLPLQRVLDKDFNVVALVRMAAETILPNVDESGRFKSVSEAYIQYELMSGRELAKFPLWQLGVARFDPDNFDDMGSLGRPFLDASRGTWRKLRMTDEDLVIRRRVRAPLRLAHTLEGASKTDLEDYQARVEQNQDQITTDYYLNKKGGVQPIQGDANLDHTKDIIYLLDTFFAGSPLPKGLMGYTDGMARDILEDLKRDYYDEVDGIQDTLAYGYEQAFRLQCLLKGINPDDEDFCIEFAERRTETPNQAVDRGLKLQALGFPQGMVFEELGYDPSYVRQRIEYERENFDPYPDPEAIAPTGTAKVKITPGNARKGESGTAIGNR
jgi:hypothetical protein